MNEVLRQEKKFLISLDQYYKYSSSLGKVLELDSHSQGEGYLIRSLYFDTLEDKDYEDKEDGVEVRRKIRLRNYGTNSKTAILEMKQKEGVLQKKRSLTVCKKDAKQLIKGNYSVLLNYKEAFAAECYSIMNMLCYRPKAVITYNRKAFVAKENKIRITFDHHICGSESSYDIFYEELNETPIFDPYLVVLEVKYNGFLLSYIKDILRECDKSEISVSKYCLGRAVSRHYTF